MSGDDHTMTINTMTTLTPETPIHPSAQPDDRSPWFVVHARPWKELLAASLLEEADLQVFLPQVRQQRRGQMQRAPLFPGYFFVRPRGEGVEFGAINHTPGVIRVVAFGEKPQPLSAAVVEAIRQQVEALEDQGGLPQHPYKPGDPVRVTAGPLEGLEAVFVGPMKPTQRVQVLLEFLGRQQQVEVDVGALEQSSAPQPVKRERRTRGKGRRIKGR